MGEVKFRDGKRVIPDYMEDLMKGLRVDKMRYDEAIEAMNRKMVTDHVDRAVDKMVSRHFMENRRGPA